MKILFFSLISIIAIVLVLIVVSDFEKTEVIQLNSKTLDETIFLKKIDRGLDFSVCLISSSKRSNEKKSSISYINNFGTPFFYKFNDTILYLYGSGWEITENNQLFKIKIIYEPINNIEFKKTSKNMEKEKLNIFPPSFMEFLDTN